MIWTSFSVRVRSQAAADWRTVARYRGFPSVGAWLASLGEQGSPEIAGRHGDGQKRRLAQPQVLEERRFKFWKTLDGVSKTSDEILKTFDGLRTTFDGF